MPACARKRRMFRPTVAAPPGKPSRADSGVQASRCKPLLSTRHGCRTTDARFCRYLTAAVISPAFHAVQSSLRGKPDTPDARPSATAPTAARWEPYRSQSDRNRTVMPTDGSASSTQIIRLLSRPLSARSPVFQPRPTAAASRCCAADGKCQPRGVYMRSNELDDLMYQ